MLKRMIFALCLTVFIAGAGRADESLHEVSAVFGDAAPQGHGALRWLAFKAYDATYWSAERGWNPKGKYALSLHYAMDFTKQELVERTIKEMTHVRPDIGDEALVSYQSDLERVYRDVKDGDHFTAISLPAEKGKPQRVQFFHNGKLTGEKQGAAFADAFFAIWLDENTTEPGLRAKLLR